MKTVAQSSIEELIGELQGLATASRRVGNHAIGNSIQEKASNLLIEIRQAFHQINGNTEKIPGTNRGIDDDTGYVEALEEKYKTSIETIHFLLRAIDEYRARLNTPPTP